MPQPARWGPPIVAALIGVGAMLASQVMLGHTASVAAQASTAATVQTTAQRVGALEAASDGRDRELATVETEYRDLAERVSGLEASDKALADRIDKVLDRARSTSP